MANKIAIFESYYEAAKDLPPEEFKEFFSAVFEKAFYGVEPEVTGMVSTMYKLVKPTIEKSVELSETRSKVGKLGGAPTGNSNASKQPKTTKNNQKQATNNQKQADKDKEEDKDKDKDIKKEIPKEKKTQTSLVNESELSEGVKAKLLEWLKYKQERKESYKETGLRALLTQVRKREQEYGAQAVCDCIDTSMSNCWKGIIWDKLAPRAAPKQNKFTSFPQRTYTHDEMSELERQLLEN